MPRQEASLREPSLIGSVADPRPPGVHIAGRAEGRPGMVLLGSDYRALGVVRSLGRRGVPVWVLCDGDDRLAAFSRYATRTVALPATTAGARVDFLADLACRYQLGGWVLLPTADEDVLLVGRHNDALARHYRLPAGPWDAVACASDKRRMHALAKSVGVDSPATYFPADVAEALRLPCRFPVIIKPSMKEAHNALTWAKAWRVDNRDELAARYAAACALMPAELLMVQEVIPGAGDSRLSYAVLADKGRVLASLVAERTRQYPPDFGRASTFVRTITAADVEELGERLIGKLGFTGLVEIEFMRDPRDGRCKLLDMNPRPWGWHSLSARAGVDFPYLLWQMLQGMTVGGLRGRPGVSWMRLSTDLPAAMREILAGRLSIVEYVRAVFGPRESAIFAWDDPLPGLLEMPLIALKVARRVLGGRPI